MDDADPEFLALPARQRRAVDRAFERGLRRAGGRASRARPAKRRRLNDSAPGAGAGTGTSAGADTPEGAGFVDDGGGFMLEDDGGGFIPDDDAGGFIPDDEGGGFIPDDDGGGGFIPDDDEGGGFIPDDDDEGGGFIPDSAVPSTRGSRAASAPDETDDRLPIRLMPSLLSSLGLPSDEDVLGVFRAMDESGVRRKDFRAVCAALMPDGDGGDENDDEDDGGEGEVYGDEESEGGDWSMSSGGSSAFEPSDDDEDFAPTKGKGKGKAAAKTRRAKALEDTGAARLSTRQREGARALWALIKPDGGGGRAQGGILSRDEVKRWVRDLGEMWSDAEITDMVTLFSGQHEGRGLTFEDFAVVMLRAGLV